MPVRIADTFRARSHSFATANRRLPDARSLERSRLFQDIVLEPGMLVCDLQAASGYVGSGIHEQYGGAIRVVSVEPALSLARTLPTTQLGVCAPLARLPLRSRCADVVLSLAGMHHSPALLPITKECFRIARADGQVALSEVERGSRMDEWLNGFVDHWLDAGHDGRFIRSGELADALREAGFREVREARAETPWLFQDEGQMVAFCQTLFGLEHVSRAIVREGIYKHLEVATSAAGVSLGWSLCFAHGRKPADH